MLGVWRLTVVAVAAALACGLAIVSLQDRTALAASGCGSGLRTLAGYTAAVQTQPDPPVAPASIVLVTVEHDGAPVSGLGVCISVDMVGMPMGNSLTYRGVQLSPGEYAVIVTFGMAGTWLGNLVVSADDRPVLSKPLRFEVS